MNDLRPQVWASHPKCHGNNISYDQALSCLANLAVKQKALRGCREEHINIEQHISASQCQSLSSSAVEKSYEEVPVLEASHRRCARDVLSPHATPATDTSAMDGFAVKSSLTASASAEHPVKFRISGMMAAGADLQDDRSLGVGCTVVKDDDRSCIEIMTGASFPEQDFPELDAVVKIEDAVIVEDSSQHPGLGIRYILVSTPVKTRQHRRPAGSDFCTGDLIIAKGMKVEPKHVMALASVGIASIPVVVESTASLSFEETPVQAKLRIGVLSSGSELINIFNLASNAPTRQSTQHRMPDSNGPYITSALRSMSSVFKVDYIGPCEDDEDSLVKALDKAVELQQYDVLVTSGGVSMGRFDLVRKAIESHIGAEIVFHGCSVRPGAPVMLGVLNSRENLYQKHTGMTTFIGAPGNPLAAAMTVRFFLRPFLRMLQASTSLTLEQLIQTAISESVKVNLRIPISCNPRKKPAHVVAFLLARSQEQRGLENKTNLFVDLLDDQASYKIKPFLQADCWISVPAGTDKILDGNQAQSYSLW